MKNGFDRLKKWINPYRNVYVIVTIVFIFWMLFFDANSWLIHRDLDKDIETLNAKKEFYIKEIEKDNNELKILKTEDGLEQYARENYNMKRDQEDLFIIDTDSLTKKP